MAATRCRWAASSWYGSLRPSGRWTNESSKPVRNRSRCILQVRSVPGEVLANRPAGVGAELEAARVVEPIHRTHQGQVAVADQLKQVALRLQVAFREGDDQPQVGGNQRVLRGHGLRIEPFDLVEQSSVRIRHARVPGEDHRPGTSDS